MMPFVYKRLAWKGLSISSVSISPDPGNSFTSHSTWQLLANEIEKVRELLTHYCTITELDACINSNFKIQILQRHFAVILQFVLNSTILQKILMHYLYFVASIYFYYKYSAIIIKKWLFEGVKYLNLFLGGLYLKLALIKHLDTFILVFMENIKQRLVFEEFT
jgi:hypothetical protein